MKTKRAGKYQTLDVKFEMKNYLHRCFCCDGMMWWYDGKIYDWLTKSDRVRRTWTQSALNNGAQTSVLCVSQSPLHICLLQTRLRVRVYLQNTVLHECVLHTRLRVRVYLQNTVLHECVLQTRLRVRVYLQNTVLHQCVKHTRLLSYTSVPPRVPRNPTRMHAHISAHVLTSRCRKQGRCIQMCRRPWASRKQRKVQLAHCICMCVSVCVCECVQDISFDAHAWVSNCAGALECCCSRAHCNVAQHTLQTPLWSWQKLDHDMAQRARGVHACINLKHGVEASDAMWGVSQENCRI
jgi:hypothetical protein